MPLDLGGGAPEGKEEMEREEGKGSEGGSGSANISPPLAMVHIYNKSGKHQQLGIINAVFCLSNI